jgi:hypothetical protein
MRIVRLGGLIVALTLMVGVSSARAAFISYTNKAAWETDVALLGLGIVTEDFSDATLVSGLSTANDDGISGGVLNASASTQVNNAGNPRLQFSPGVKAFGGIFDLAGPGGPGDGLLFQINGTAAVPSGTNSAFVGGTYNGFVGFISDNATLITSVRFDAGALTGDETFSLDNLEISTAATPPAVPEPGSLTLLGMGLAATVRAVRKRQQRSA